MGAAGQEEPEFLIDAGRPSLRRQQLGPVRRVRPYACRCRPDYYPSLHACTYGVRACVARAVQAASSSIDGTGVTCARRGRSGTDVRLLAGGL